MNIGEVLSRGWDIIWKNKVLWIFGLLASLAGGSGGNNTNYNLTQDGGARSFPVNIPSWELGILFLLFLVLLVVVVVLATLGHAGLVRGAWLADSGETNLTFSRLFRESQAYFGRVLLLGILAVLISLVLVLAMLVPSVLTCGLFALCMVPLFIVISMIVNLAIIAIVGENLGIVESVRRAWEIIRANWALVIAVGLVIVIGTSIIGFLVSLPLIAILAPIFVFFNTNTGQFGNGAFIISLFLFLLYLPILLAVHAIITAYVESTWTVAFRRLTGRPAGSAIALPLEPAPIS